MSYLSFDEYGRQFYMNENDELHREDGPALIDDVAEEWWVNGYLHREDGPAIIYRDGADSVWMVKGCRIF